MEIVCTIGPATFSRSMIRMLGCAGVTIFRLNLSHTQIFNEICRFDEFVKEETNSEICLDTHGLKFCSTKQKVPSFTKFDKKALGYGEGFRIDYVAVSYAQSAQMIQEAKTLSKATYIIAKIESKGGVENKKEIIKAADAVLIDRGDLSRSYPIEETPRLCKEIISSCKEANTPVWVATNLLESMTINPYPTMGEVNDIANLLQQGVDGLVLAAETAIGKHPIQCVEFVRKMIDRYAT